ncbi:MAG TPA: xanthine dehydrogenase family protein subunit M [Acetobacteraceae bacterium]|nr:xanthine dehydrogenase family protein subunit M [Acetobacteraceae bacterium]
MLPFGYVAAGDAAGATELVAQTAEAMFIAGGTDMLQLLREAVIAPSVLIDISRLPCRGIAAEGDGLRIGALTCLADVADDTRVQREFPVLAQALNETASPQVRNMATVGGNLLQRTRCLYFRDAAVPCNKREPGSGCPAQDGQNRVNAILGGSAHCIAAYPGDLANALIVLDAELVLHGRDGERRMRVEALHREPGDTPQIETNLREGDIITAVVLPATARSGNSHYLKLRDRASFEWALVSAAAAVEITDGAVRSVRVAAGGVGTRPWRLVEVERLLLGRRLDGAMALTAAEVAPRAADPRPGNAFKVPLLQRAIERVLRMAGGLA